MASDASAERCRLSNADIVRYGRQLVLPGWGVAAQERVAAAKVLVVGAGGLGCPAAMYLAGAGVAKLGLVDDDVVERSNLHRQIGHTDDRVGEAKAQSLRRTCLQLNPSIDVVAFTHRFTAANALDLADAFDVLVDATDNVSSKYLANDAAVLAGKPLVSAAALGFEGQITVYDVCKGGPCYRCVFPQPPPPHLVADCSSGGVLGPVPGVLGAFQAIETLKVIASSAALPPLRQRLLTVDTATMTCRTVRLRGRQPHCSVCGPDAMKQDRHQLLQHLAQSMQKPPCEASAEASDASSSCDVSVDAYANLRRNLAKHVLLDVREAHQFAIASLPGAINVPLRKLTEWNGLNDDADRDTPIYVICRRGNASKVAVAQLLKMENLHRRVYNVKGGLAAWATAVDADFPIY